MNKDDVIVDKINNLKRTIAGNISDVTNIFDKRHDIVKTDVYESVETFLEGMNEVDLLGYINDHITKVSVGMGKFFKGVFYDGFIGFGKGLELIYTNAAGFMSWSGEFVFSHILCGMSFIESLSSCIFWYALDTLLYIFKTFLGFFIDVDYWINYSKLEKYLKYPDYTHKCYNCKRLRTAAVNYKGQYINHSFKYDLPAILSAGYQEVVDGINEMSQ